MAAPPPIFVAIASYRDAECQHTVRDLFERAANPARVSAGIIWQVVPREDGGCFAVRTRPRQVRELIFDAREARGACWAKRRALDLRDGSPFVLLVDSHMRFHPRWDVGLREMLAACPSGRPALSTYPAPYEPPRLSPGCQTPRMLAGSFDEAGVLSPRAQEARLRAPERGAFMAGGFVFSPAGLWDEVPYDPALYFVGEEVTLAARAFTNGWDVFAPPTCVVHHYYRRAGAPKHWRDDPTWAERNALSVKRVRHLLGAAPSADPRVTAGLDGPLGLGRARPLADFERLAGVDFRRSVVLRPGGAA